MKFVLSRNEIYLFILKQQVSKANPEIQVSTMTLASKLGLHGDRLNTYSVGGSKPIEEWDTQDIEFVPVVPQLMVSRERNRHGKVL